jgi:hypothetical protein
MLGGSLVRLAGASSNSQFVPMERELADHCGVLNTVEGHFSW